MRPASLHDRARHSGKFVGVQYLRGIAALLVVLHHIRNPVEGLFNPVAGYSAGQRGVDVFFVISGFIMFTAARDESFVQFLLRRVVRVVPLYWLATLALAAVLAVSGKMDTAHWVALGLSLLFVPHYSAELPGAIMPLLDPGWTLNYEMFFYLLFAVALLTRRVVPSMTAAIAALVLAGVAVQPTSPVAATYTNPLLLEFLGGLLIGYLFHRHAPPALDWLIWPGFVLLLLPGADDGARVIAAGLPALAIVAGVISADIAGKTPHSAFLKLMGDASYSIYLSHYFTLRLAIAAWRRLPIEGWPQFIGFAVTGGVGSVAVGILVYRYVERPLTLFFKMSRPFQRNARFAPGAGA